MNRELHTAEAILTGGRTEGHGRTSDGELEVDFRLPKELGGDGDGTNPEERCAVGFATRCEGALGAVGRRERAEGSARTRRRRGGTSK